MITFGIAFVATLTIEAPFISLEKLVISGKLFFNNSIKFDFKVMVHRHRQVFYQEQTKRECYYKSPGGEGQVGDQILKHVLSY